MRKTIVRIARVRSFMRLILIPNNFDRELTPSTIGPVSKTSPHHRRMPMAKPFAPSKRPRSQPRRNGEWAIFPSIFPSRSEDSESGANRKLFPALKDVPDAVRAIQKSHHIVFVKEKPAERGATQIEGLHPNRGVVGMSWLCSFTSS